jgi:hypothetical protein
MKSSILYAGAALACALALSACGGGSGDLPLTVNIAGGVTKTGLTLRNQSNGDEIKVEPGFSSVQFPKFLSTDDEFNIVASTLPSNVSDCKITNGKARANYYTVYTTVPAVFCTIKLHDLNVTVQGLTGTGLVLVNAPNTQAVAPGTGTVALAQVPEDGPYIIKVLDQPKDQFCEISGGNGTMTATGPSTTPVVTCVPKP